MTYRTGRWAIGTIVLTAFLLPAQLTPEQKALDFQSIASLYAKQYAPYEWKRDSLGFDLFDLRPWLERARQTKDDVGYLELLSEYTASLQDAHSYYTVNSDFTADLHLYADIYDGKVLIEQIDRFTLPLSKFDFVVGDEIVQFDGRPVFEVMAGIQKLNSFPNPRSTQRWAADQLTYRAQALLPRAPEMGDTATILVRRADGSEKSYVLLWDKSGTPLKNLGRVPDFRLSDGGVRGADEPRQMEPERRSAREESSVAADPAYLRAWLSLQREMLTRPMKNLRGFASRQPIYRMPTGFVQRLGRMRADNFFSGTYQRDGKRIGLIRIGTFSPATFSLVPAALRQFAQEIAYMKGNTDVLIVDVTRNPGGYGCYAEGLTQYLVSKPYVSTGFEIRPNLSLIRELEYAIQAAEQFGEEWEVAQFRAILKDLQSAYSENRGRTGTLPLCSSSLDVEPARDANGALAAYDKPILVLTDEFSTSAAEIFAATLQDADAVRLFGYRTAGAGGNTESNPAGFYSEGSAAVTQMLAVRPKMQTSPGFPASRYLENVGVQPNEVYDYQTKENLLGNGVPFVEAFTSAALAIIPSSN